MKYFTLLALYLGAVIADDLQQSHYNLHQQTVEMAKMKVYNGLRSPFENVDPSSGVGVGTVGSSSTGLTSSRYSSLANPYCCTRPSDNIASTSTFGSNAHYSDSSSHHSATSGSNFINSGLDVQKVMSEGTLVPGSRIRDDRQSSSRYLNSVGSESHVTTPIFNKIYTAGDSERHYNQEHDRFINQHVQFPSRTSEQYVHQEEQRRQSHLVPVGQLVSEQYAHVEKESRRQTPNQIVIRPINERESIHQYKKTASDNHRQAHSQTFLDSSLSQQIDYSGTTQNQLNDQDRVSNRHVPLVFNTPIITGDMFGSEKYVHDEKHQFRGQVVPPAYVPLRTSEQYLHQEKQRQSTTSEQYAQQHQGTLLNPPSNQHLVGSGAHFGSESRLNSKFDSPLESGFSFGVDSTSELRKYMEESQRLAKLQSQGVIAAGRRTGGSQVDSNLESVNNMGVLDNIQSFGDSGGFKGGFKAKTWEKSSEMSSKSEIGSDGHVKSYSELSTGEREHYNINGRQSGYKAATTTLDDNGKRSSYSIHT